LTQLEAHKQVGTTPSFTLVTKQCPDAITTTDGD